MWSWRSAGWVAGDRGVHQVRGDVAAARGSKVLVPHPTPSTANARCRGLAPAARQRNLTRAAWPVAVVVSDGRTAPPDNESTKASPSVSTGTTRRGGGPASPRPVYVQLSLGGTLSRSKGGDELQHAVVIAHVACQPPQAAGACVMLMLTSNSPPIGRPALASMTPAVLGSASTAIALQVRTAWE